MSQSLPRVLKKLVHDRFAEEVAFLAEMVKVPSDNPSGDCAAHAARTSELLGNLGFTVESHPVPQDVVKAHGMISVTNLIIRHRFGPGPVIALNAHGDVVPPGEGWTKNPYGAEVVDGWMYGRGVAVSKSDFATYAFALDALKRSGLKLNGTVELHLSYDEEAGGEIGPGWILAQGLSKPDMAIAAGFSYAVVDAHNGCLHLEVVVEGVSAHAALPHTGIDALEATTPILAALYGYRKELAKAVSATQGIGSPQITVGLIKGGINTNVVPDRITFRLDRRMIPEENPETVEQNLRDLIHAAAGIHPKAKVTINRILLARPLMPTAKSKEISNLLCKRASVEFETPVSATGVPLYTDARLYAERGIPIALYGAGPRSIEEANAHRADERLRLSDLEKATVVIAETLADLLA